MSLRHRQSFFEAGGEGWVHVAHGFGSWGRRGGQRSRGFSLLTADHPMPSHPTLRPAGPGLAHPELNPIPRAPRPSERARASYPGAGCSKPCSDF